VTSETSIYRFDGFGGIGSLWHERFASTRTQTTAKDIFRTLWVFEALKETL
jgi:hypothetical protein